MNSNWEILAETHCFDHGLIVGNFIGEEGGRLFGSILGQKDSDVFILETSDIEVLNVWEVAAR